MARDREDCAIYEAYEDFEPLLLQLPERKLLTAIILRAVHDYHLTGPSRDQALDYLLSDEDDYIFSFRSVCSYLEVDADEVLRWAGVKDLQDSEEHSD